MRRAVFLDRDGVLVPDLGLLRESDRVTLLPDVPRALSRLADAGFALVVITNQPIIARGIASEEDIIAVNDRIGNLIAEAAGPRLTGFYVCPHHPNATIESYRLDCECRKPKPGLLRRAAAEHDLDLSASYMVGDRITDIVAGIAAGCTTVLVESGCHLDPIIVTSVAIDPDTVPDFVCLDLPSAADWILAQ